MDMTFRIPGTSGPEIVVSRPLLGSLRVLVDGVRAKRTSKRRLEYAVPLGDGTTTTMTLTGQWRGLRATVDGETVPLERQLSRGELVLVMLPFGLIVGGLIGGLYGAIGAAVNARLARLIRPAALRAAAMIGVTVLAAGIWFRTALAIAPVPTYAVGSCLNGLASGGAAPAVRSVNCATGHDGEVIGTNVDARAGAYPGQDALVAAAEAPCLTAFAGYVGRDYAHSAIEMIVLVPTDVTWQKGDRTIDCVAVSKDGSNLTGSIRGSGR